CFLKTNPSARAGFMERLQFVHAELFEQMTRKTAIDFLQGTLKALPYHVHTILTDNGIQFAKKTGTGTYREHPFDVLCNQHGIEHRLTKPFHPWTNGQIERMNRTIKDATTKAFYYTSLEEFRSHLKDYLWAYNSARPLRA
ncbi:integrase core domain-containing protein, partial [Stutzerimonas nitrititolerans]|uniref:integrase core domain-containing protein n=1 Tax=Stutzerimonas nitrititolerans TaxID=2482751 RepID=UPI00289F293A